MVQLTSIVVALVAASTAVSAGHSFERVRKHHVPVQLRATASAKASSAKATGKVSVASSNETESKTGDFVHPGVFVSGPQIAFVKEQVDAKKEPWNSAYKQLLSDDLMKMSRKPNPFSSVDCGSTSQNPSNGCTDEREDAMAAYGMALAFSISGDSKYAEKAADYMDAWAGKIKKHTASNAPLQTGWSGASWARAGELIKHSYPKWNSASFENMIKTVYLPDLKDGDDRAGNWDLVMLEAALGMSVFLDDKATYDHVMTKYKGRVPAYVYLKSDGKTPEAAPGSPQAGGSSKNKRGPASITGFWFQQTNFDESGIAQETCRDFVHTGYGLASIGHAAETALIQGDNLYSSDVGERLQHALEFHAGLMMGDDKPSWLCPGKGLKLNMEHVQEVGYNAMATQGGASMPKTKALIEKFRKQNNRGNALFVAWETLTHAENPTNFNGAGNSTRPSTEEPTTGDDEDDSTDGSSTEDDSTGDDSTDVSADDSADEDSDDSDKKAKKDKSDDSDDSYVAAVSTATTSRARRCAVTAAATA